MGEFIEKEVEFLVESEILEQREVEGEKMYKVQKKVFTEMEMRVYGVIFEKRKTGTVLS